MTATISHLGTWMQNVAAAWEMTQLSDSSLLVALVQAATALPICVLAIPAGAMADVLDKRQLLFITGMWQMLVAAVLAAIAFSGQLSVVSLLFGTGLLATGAALASPAWQAMTSDLVHPSQVPAAIALNGFSMNAARAIGPALGGWLVASLGTSAAFLLNALSFLAVIFVVASWTLEQKATSLPAERMLGAMRAGLRYVRHTPDVRVVLVRSFLFVMGASSIWALLPAVVASRPELGPGNYGVLLGFIGLGALFGVFVLPKLTPWLGSGGVLLCASATFAVAELLMATSAPFVWLCLGMIPTGLAWICGLTTINSTVQIMVPLWVRGRVLSVHLLIFFGGLTAGSFGWGLLSQLCGISHAMISAGITTVLGLGVSWFFPLPKIIPNETEPFDWPDVAELGPSTNTRPVLVQVHYLIASEQRASFAGAIAKLRQSRYRNGAIRWELAEDLNHPGLFQESFLVESWNEHLRQHERQTKADAEALEGARHCHSGSEPPRVIHWKSTTPGSILSSDDT